MAACSEPHSTKSADVIRSINTSSALNDFLMEGRRTRSAPVRSRISLSRRPSLKCGTQIAFPTNSATVLGLYSAGISKPGSPIGMSSPRLSSLEVKGPRTESNSVRASAASLNPPGSRNPPAHAMRLARCERPSARDCLSARPT